jgi:alkyl hydroperoxide reductase subunit AhpC
LQLQQRHGEIRQRQVQVVVVTFEPKEQAQQYAAETGVAWPVLIDESRTLYEEFGMHRGSFWSIWSPRNWWAYLRLILRGRMPGLPHHDVYQLGGDVLIDPSGTIRMCHVCQTPKDRPPVDSILAVIDSAEST